jgi:mannose-6-phosphate isomerase class I
MATFAAIPWFGWTISRIKEAICELEADAHKMNTSADNDIEAWESEGGAAPAPFGVRAISMRGTANQVEWAERIKGQVNEEFDRVARSFRSVAVKQSDAARADTEAIIAILEEKCAEVMSRGEAGYFIHDWQEISDQVRQMIFHDVRYQAIKNNRLQNKFRRKAS